MQKIGFIKEINGIVVSDPSYTKEVVCRYETSKKLVNQRVIFNSKIEDQYTVFDLTLGEPENLGKIKINDDGSLTYPRLFKMKKSILGMDRHSIYIGKKSGFGEFDDNVIETGTDGLFGECLQFTHNRKIVAIVIFGEIDGEFMTNKELWEYFVASFDITE